MEAGFGWIDFSEEHRDRVFSVVDLLSPDSSVDELGVGTVRDAIADWLFPGVSTIQTRPKYFIIIPQIFLSYLKKMRQKEKLPRLSDFVRLEEHRIMNQLSENYNYAEGNGIIGVNVARNKGELARKPTSIYWNGLKIHGIIDSNFSLSEYLQHNNFSNFQSSSHKDENSDDDMALWNENFGIKCPIFSEIDAETRMDLSENEARFLRDQFIGTNGGVKNEANLLAQILQSPERIEMMKVSNNFREMANKLLQDDSLNAETKRVLKIALNFDMLIHGAHIRYNVQLHKKAGTRANNFEEDWNEWIGAIDKFRNELEKLDFNIIFLELATRTDTNTQQFMRRWKDLILSKKVDIEEVDNLVRKQEINKKKGKAKLTSTKGEYTDWVGLRELQYRFYQAKNIIIDIDNAYVESQK